MNPHPSDAQMETLIEYMEQHPQLARFQIRNTTGRYDTKVKWEELTKILNSMDGLQKNAKQWSKFWSDKKYNIKRRLIHQRNAPAYRQRFGNHPMPLPLSKLDAKILLMMGLDELECSKIKKKSPATHKVELVEPKPGPASRAVAHKASQTDDTSLCRRSPRCLRHQRSQVTIERQRLAKMERKSVAAETAPANDFRKAVRALDDVARAAIQCGQTIDQALNKLR